MGFAVVENFNYMMEYGDIMTLVSRSLLTVPAHACFGIMMGGYLLVAFLFVFKFRLPKISPKQILYMLAIMLVVLGILLGINLWVLN